MRRRIFLRNFGADGVLGLGWPWVLAPTQASARHPLGPLLLVSEQEAYLDGYMQRVYALCIGFGPAGERIVEEAHKQEMAFPYACIHRPGGDASSNARDWLASRLERCISALLVIDAQNPRILNDSLSWATQLAEYDVNLRAAVLLDWTTAVGWNDEAMLPLAIGNACLPLEPKRCTGAIAFIHGWGDLTLREFDATVDRLNKLLPDDAVGVVGSILQPDWQKGRRIVSLTLTGDGPSC